MNEELIQPVAQPVTEKEDAAPTAEKSFTLRSAKSELRRLEKARDSKRETIKRLQDELKELTPKIKQMAALVEQLSQEETHRKILATFSGKKMSQAQVSKALDLIQKLDGDLDNVSVDQIAAIVHSAAEDARGKDTPVTASEPDNQVIPKEE